MSTSLPLSLSLARPLPLSRSPSLSLAPSLSPSLGASTLLDRTDQTVCGQSRASALSLSLSLFSSTNTAAIDQGGKDKHMWRITATRPSWHPCLVGCRTVRRSLRCHTHCTSTAHGCTPSHTHPKRSFAVEAKVILCGVRGKYSSVNPTQLQTAH